MPEPRLTAAVVGAGIGGLATAIALREAGWNAQVLERGNAVETGGAALGIWPNGVRALRALGLAGELDAIGCRLSSVALRRADGHVLATHDVALLERRTGAPLLAVHRAELLAAELNALGGDAVRFGAEVVGVERGKLRLAGGGTVSADLVVGADGLRSVVRSALLGDGEPRSSGLVAFRGVAAWPQPVPAGEWWGPRGIAGLFPLTGGRVYWYAAYRRADGGEVDAVELAEGFASPVREIVRATAPGEVLTHELFDRKPSRRMAGGRIACVGDAAHPMLPFLGQGACAALEDAVALGRSLSGARPGEIEARLRQYDQARAPAAARLVRGSRAAGAIALLRPRPLRALRNGLVRSTPPRVQLRRLERIVGSDDA